MFKYLVVQDVGLCVPLDLANAAGSRHSSQNYILIIPLSLYFFFKIHFSSDSIKLTEPR